jgi:hypothetical protein
MKECVELANFALTLAAARQRASRPAEHKATLALSGKKHEA